MTSIYNLFIHLDYDEIANEGMDDVSIPDEWLEDGEMSSGSHDKSLACNFCSKVPIENSYISNRMFVCLFASRDLITIRFILREL